MTREAIDLLENLIGMVEDNHDSDYDTALKMGIKALEQEPKTGHWIVRLKDVWYECSECHDYTDHQTNYCSNCGAKMESEDKE